MKHLCGLTYNKANFRNALISSTVLEAVFFFLGVREMYIGGIEEFGGYFFSLLHLPSSLVLAFVFRILQINGQTAEIIFVLLATFLQIALLTTLFYCAMQRVQKK